MNWRWQLVIFYKVTLLHGVQKKEKKEEEEEEGRRRRRRKRRKRRRRRSVNNQNSRHKAILYKLIVTHLVRSLCILLGTENSLPCSQQPAADFY
jgi:hypothetical protein